MASSAAFAASFRASYQAPPECPDRTAFVRAVEQRLSGWSHQEDPNANVERELAVSIDKTSGGYAAKLSLGATEGNRELDGAQCDSLVRALSLIAAVSLDPAAALSIEEQPEAVSPPRSEPSPAPAPAPPTEDKPSTPEPSPPASGPSGAFGLAAGLMLGPAPAPLYGVEAHAELGDSERRFLARLAGAMLATGSVDVGSASAHFELLHAELGGCYRPIREQVLVMGCAVFDVGRMAATGESSPALTETESSTRLWLAAGARMGLGVRLLGPLELALTAGLLVPLVRQSYVFENPRESVHESAVVALDLTVGLIAVVF
jgi:hypothetical protein